MRLSSQGIRKAAILITALDRHAADRLLEGMRPEEAQRVRDAVFELGEVDPAERRRVIDEFLRCRPTLPSWPPSPPPPA
ncbi:MAG TPA: hypothetical protein EYP56_02090, partial [Planctomycetaceae bacterium]|nr:hypothetical protein [Planctomycetaceae bacterium]